MAARNEYFTPYGRSITECATIKPRIHEEEIKVRKRANELRLKSLDKDTRDAEKDTNDEIVKKLRSLVEEELKAEPAGGGAEAFTVEPHRPGNREVCDGYHLYFSAPDRDRRYERQQLAMNNIGRGMKGLCGKDTLSIAFERVDELTVPERDTPPPVYIIERFPESIRGKGYEKIKAMIDKRLERLKEIELVLEAGGDWNLRE